MLRETVTIATSDNDFAKTIKLFSEFGDHVTVRDVTAESVDRHPRPRAWDWAYRLGALERSVT